MIMAISSVYVQYLRPVYYIMNLFIFKFWQLYKETYLEWLRQSAHDPMVMSSNPGAASYRFTHIW